MASFIGKVALITGASSGIGAGTAVHLASLGCKLSLTGRNENNLGKVVEDCKKAGANSADILKIKGDVANEEDVKMILQATIDHFGRLDILINNAGILQPGSTETSSLESYDETMRINVRSVLQLTQLAIPHLKKMKGNIVNVSSIAGTRSYIHHLDLINVGESNLFKKSNCLVDFPCDPYSRFPGIIAYSMSKAAIDQLTRCTALELASDGVRVNAVNPGVIVTEVHKRGGMSDADYTKFLERCKETHALGRPGQVHEVAQAIAFFADNNASSFITGVTMPIDGGRGIMCPR